MVTSLCLDDGRQLAWQEYGDALGWPVAVIHGTPGCRLLPVSIDRDAAEAGTRVVSVDRPGFGRSSFSPNRQLVDWSADLRSLVDHLGWQRFSVVGYSGGGPYALLSGLALGDRIAAVGVVAGVGPLDSPERRAAMPEESRPVYEAAASGPGGAAPMMEA